MQSHLKICQAIDDIFQNKTTSIIKSYLTPEYWVSTICEDFGDDVQTFSCIGVFSTEKQAVQATLRYLVQQKYIDETPFQMEKLTTKYSLDYQEGYQEENEEKLIIEQVKTKEDLQMVCEKYGNPWKKEQWNYELSIEEVDVCLLF